MVLSAPKSLNKLYGVKFEFFFGLLKRPKLRQVMSCFQLLFLAGLLMWSWSSVFHQTKSERISDSFIQCVLIFIPDILRLWSSCPRLSTALPVKDKLWIKYYLLSMFWVVTWTIIREELFQTRWSIAKSPDLKKKWQSCQNWHFSHCLLILQYKLCVVVSWFCGPSLNRCLEILDAEQLQAILPNKDFSSMWTFLLLI